MVVTESGRYGICTIVLIQIRRSIYALCRQKICVIVHKSLKFGGSLADNGQYQHDCADQMGILMADSTAADLGSPGSAARSRRAELGLDQQELADLAGVSVRFIHALEHGKPTVRLDKLSSVLDVLGLELRVALRHG